MISFDQFMGTKDGRAVLIDWLGEGGTPVSAELANHRSFACLNADNLDRCPENRGVRWWERAKDTIATVIRHQLAIKHHMDLHVVRETELQMCRACGCCIRLKVWTPIEHIKAHTPPETLKKFPSHCWILRELKP